jgi:hypothetical protein
MRLAQGWFAGAGKAEDLPQRHRNTEVNRRAGELAVRNRVVSAELGCKGILYIGIQTHKKLDNDTLNMYYGEDF